MTSVYTWVVVIEACPSSSCTTRTFAQTAREIALVLDPKSEGIPFGIRLMIGKNYTVFLADTTINERPSAEQLAHIAKETAAVAKRLGHEPRVAFLSYSTFGNPPGQWLDNIRDAVAIRLQGISLPRIGEIPVQAIQALPYLMTVILLAGVIGTAIPPRASGIPYVKER